MYAQNTELPASLRVALDHYAELDPLAVTWSKTTEATHLGREKIAPDVIGRITARSYTTQLAFREGRIYMRRESKTGSAKSNRVEQAFDRNVLHFGEPAQATKRSKSRLPYLHHWIPGKDQPEARYFRADYFRVTGVRIPSRVKELEKEWRPESELLALLSEGGRVEATGTAELEGHKLIRVQVKALDSRAKTPPIDLAALERELRRPPSLSEKEIQERLQDARESNAAQPPQRRYDFYFDPQRGYAVRRLNTRDEAGRLVLRYDCTEHEQLQGRTVWLPRLGRMEEYTFVGLPDQVFESPLFVNQFQALTFDLKPWPEERFELKYSTPGTRINDATFPEVEGKNGIHYTMPANFQQLDEVVAAARAKYHSRANAKKGFPRLRILVLILNGVVLVSVVVYYIVRWRRKSRSA